MRLISAADVRDRLSVPLAADAIRGALREHAEGRTATSSPPLLRLALPEDTWFQAKAARVGGVVGLRVAGERGGQHVDEGRRLLLYDAVSLLPVAILDERELYRCRVGAQLAVTIDGLRRRDSTSLTVVGAGRLARAAVGAIQELTPFEQVRLYARTPTSRSAAVEELRSTNPGEISAADDLGEALASADVVVTLTTARRPVVHGDALKPGTLVVSAGGGWECDVDVYERADRLIVDDWEHCIQVGDLAALAQRGVVERSMVSSTLAEVVWGSGVMPCGNEELVVAVPQGMTILDVAVAAAVLKASGSGR